jgi:hypothetical protein
MATEKTTEQRLHAVYILITAAKELIEGGNVDTGVSFLQTARRIAKAKNEDLELKKETIENDLASAERIFKKISRERLEF